METRCEYVAIYLISSEKKISTQSVPHTQSREEKLNTMVNNRTNSLRAFERIPSRVTWLFFTVPTREDNEKRERGQHGEDKSNHKARHFSFTTVSLAIVDGNDIARIRFPCVVHMPREGSTYPPTLLLIRWSRIRKKVGTNQPTQGSQGYSIRNAKLMDLWFGTTTMSQFGGSSISSSVQLE